MLRSYSFFHLYHFYICMYSLIFVFIITCIFLLCMPVFFFFQLVDQVLRILLYRLLDTFAQFELGDFQPQMMTTRTVPGPLGASEIIPWLFFSGGSFPGLGSFSSAENSGDSPLVSRVASLSGQLSLSGISPCKLHWPWSPWLRPQLGLVDWGLCLVLSHICSLRPSRQ